MLQRESAQKDFFDSYVYESLLPEKHILLDIRSKIDFSFVEDAVKSLYSDNMGRPFFPPIVLFNRRKVVQRIIRQDSKSKRYGPFKGRQA